MQTRVTPASKESVAAAWDTYSNPPDMCPIEVRVAAAADAACRVNRAEVVAEVVKALRYGPDGNPWPKQNHNTKAANFIEREFATTASNQNEGPDAA